MKVNKKVRPTGFAIRIHARLRKIRKRSHKNEKKTEYEI